jgi:hypothetical protein
MQTAAHVLPGDIPHIDQVAVDLRALSFAGVVSMAASALFGLAPVLATLRTNLACVYEVGGRPGSHRRPVVRFGGLLPAEIAFSMVLLAGAAR